MDYSEKLSKYDPVANITGIKQEIFFQFALNDFYIPVEKALELTVQVKKNKSVKWYNANHGMNNQSFDDAKDWLVDLAFKLPNT